MKTNNDIKCPHCGVKLEDLLKRVDGRCNYTETGRFTLQDLINYIDNIDEIDDEDELEDQLSQSFGEIDTEETEHDNYDTDDEYMECRNCHNQISTREIAEIIIANRADKLSKDNNLSFFVKNADKFQ